MIKYIKEGDKIIKVVKTENGETIKYAVSLEAENLIEISLNNLTEGLIGTPLFRELNNYINVSPALKLFIGDGILTPDEIVKLKAQLELDRDDQVLSVALHDYLVGKLGELENAV